MVLERNYGIATKLKGMNADTTNSGSIYLQCYFNMLLVKAEIWWKHIIKPIEN